MFCYKNIIIFEFILCKIFVPCVISYMWLLDLETKNGVEKEKWERRDWREMFREGKKFLFNYLMKQLHIVPYLYYSHNASRL
jgi:hypothetical protein